MKIEISLPIYLDKVLSRLNAAGFESYLVGGAIRDTLLGIKPHDYDVTTNANKTEIAQIFSDMTVFQAGSAFSTMILVISPSISIEITSFRSKDPNTLGQSLEEDLGLRDFTIDSMAIDEEKNLYDFNKGLEDLKARKIRTVGSPKERFLEDPLRMLRYFRLMAKFNFSGDDNTLQAIKDNASLISKVSPERIRDTLKDILIIRPTLFKEMSEVGLLIYIIKDVDDLFSVSQNNPWHYTDVGNHTIDALRFFENYHDLSSEDRYILSNAILFHDLGKRDCKTTDAKGIDHFYQHEEVSETLASGIMEKYKYSNSDKALILKLIKNHSLTLSMTKRCFLRLITRRKLSKHEFFLLTLLMQADEFAHVDGDKRVASHQEVFSYLLDMYDRNASGKKELTVNSLALNGKDIIKEMNINPGPEVGFLKQKLFEAVILGSVKNEKEDLLSYLKSLK